MNRVIIFLATFFLDFSLLFAQNSYQQYVESGNSNLSSRNYKAAISDYEQALSEQPNDTAALFGVIRASLLANDLKVAEKYIDRAFSMNSGNSELFLRRGILSNLKGDFEKGIDDFNAAIESNPSQELQVQILLNRAAALLRLERYQQAIDDYNQALEMSPRNSSIYNYKGFANYKMGNYLDAIADYSNAIDLDPNNSSSYYNRGMAYIKNAEKQKACMDFHKSCNMKNINACKMIMTECAGK